IPVVPAAPPVVDKVSAPEPVEVAAAPASAEVHEVDLSDEWASLLEETRPTHASVEASPPAASRAGAPPVAEFEIPVEEPSTEEVAQSSGEISAAPAAPATHTPPPPKLEEAPASGKP